MFSWCNVHRRRRRTPIDTVYASSTARRSYVRGLTEGVARGRAGRLASLGARAGSRVALDRGSDAAARLTAAAARLRPPPPPPAAAAARPARRGAARAPFNVLLRGFVQVYINIFTSGTL